MHCVKHKYFYIFLCVNKYYLSLKTRKMWPQNRLKSANSTFRAYHNFDLLFPRKSYSYLKCGITPLACERISVTTARWRCKKQYNRKGSKFSLIFFTFSNHMIEIWCVFFTLGWVVHLTTSKTIVTFKTTHHTIP